MKKQLLEIQTNLNSIQHELTTKRNMALKRNWKLTRLSLVEKRHLNKIRSANLTSLQFRLLPSRMMITAWCLVSSNHNHNVVLRVTYFKPTTYEFFIFSEVQRHVEINCKNRVLCFFYLLFVRLESTKILKTVVFMFPQIIFAGFCWDCFSTYKLT